VGQSLPKWLLNENSTVYHKRHISLKGEDKVEPVQLIQTLLTHFARVQFGTGRTDSVSTRNLAPGPYELNSQSDTDTSDDLDATLPMSNESHPDHLCSPSTPSNEIDQIKFLPTDALPDCSPNSQQTDSSHVSRSGREIKRPSRFADYVEE